MSNTFRAFTFCLTSCLLGSTIAQNPHELTVFGTVTGCLPGQTVNIQTLQGTSPAYDIEVPINADNCSFFAVLWIESDTASVEGSTICNGQLVTANDAVAFSALVDSGFVGLWLSCNTSTDPDCFGIPGGPNQPGYICFDDLHRFGIWNDACVCIIDSLPLDCSGIPNGPNLPGTPCVIPGTTIEGTWSNACVCEANNTDPCQADFWVLQAYGQDSLPIPYELWVWNLSTGSGTLTYVWNFGDGTSSTEAYPTHTYAGNGPYNLCLSITDDSGCTSTHCDSISIDNDGMYTGMVGGEGDRQDGFTINVQPANGSNGITELNAGDVALWPNPVADELNVALNSALRGTAIFTVIDLNGRVVLNERHALNGRTQLRLATEALEPGMYTLRITDGARTVASQRFVKAN
ncbi:MAG: PKD domain-containing protein [Flavobacteriales bacterium]